EQDPRVRFVCVNHSNVAIRLSSALYQYLFHNVYLGYTDFMDAISESSTIRAGFPVRIFSILWPPGATKYDVPTAATEKVYRFSNFNIPAKRIKRLDRQKNPDRLRANFLAHRVLPVPYKDRLLPSTPEACWIAGEAFIRCEGQFFDSVRVIVFTLTPTFRGEESSRKMCRGSGSILPYGIRYTKFFNPASSWENHWRWVMEL
ncbi:unnamed protein product, partial [Nesidiocoris tenuis]